MRISRKLRTLARIFVFVFCAGLLTLALIFHSSFLKRTDQRDEGLIRTLPFQYVSVDTLNPQQSKSSHFLWVNKPLSRDGVALKLLENPELFASSFPGYPEVMRTDRSLWDTYFNQDMFVLDWLFLPLTAVLSSHSSFGGIEIFKRYGADVLIFGNSEAQSISPAILNRELSGGFKVLGVEVPASTLKITRAVADRMAMSGQRSDWAILGVPLSNLFFHSDSAQKMERRILTRFSMYEHQSDHSLLSFVDSLREAKLDKYFTMNSLDDFSPSHGERKSNNGKAFPISWLKPELGLAERLERSSSQWRLQSDILSSIDERDCEMERANEEVDLALRSILKVSKRILVILTPASSLELRGMPACFPEAAKKLLNSKVNTNIFISTASDSSVGITLANYVSIDAKGTFAYLDQNHLNSDGAYLFTKYVAHRLREQVNQ